ncbi:hypothetical protein [Candidatus Nitrosocosmicus arcticus]|uniref:Uncharacterized protein n=1 Tax=Candidatus Nitrosocosmicus arcticus TaxID=2035267 RepID=A0A557SVG8_9ARCH|nr:hypothetical protein [Candidatus Nitrosocosmicus arcticus]TVP40609.1 hypothetical protein NARC_70191 [Candidatus Nitrosocosmicus arcticus]
MESIKFTKEIAPSKFLSVFGMVTEKKTGSPHPSFPMGKEIVIVSLSKYVTFTIILVSKS